MIIDETDIFMLYLTSKSDFVFYLLNLVSIDFVLQRVHILLVNTHCQHAL
jgi:hypothetical protein